MLQRRQVSDEPLFINLTPMIDVILTLLVFFITASRIEDWEEDERRLDVALPQVAYAQPLTQGPDDIRLTVKLDGSLWLNEEPVTLDQLRQKLQAARERYAAQGVLVRADGHSLHQQVAEVLSACHAAGIAQIRISVKSPAG
jgi:biopolymer transport protein ExbD